MTPRLSRSAASQRPSTRHSAEDAVALARDRFLRGQRIDLQDIAAELGINRVTLYRWVGTHERLMGQVCCGFAEHAWADARAIPDQGPEYAVRVLHRFLRRIQAFPAFQDFVVADPEYALKVLTSKHSPTQERVIALVRELLDEQAQAGRLTLPDDLDSLAYALVRICESFLYNDLITGRRPDLDKAKPLIAALLQAPWSALRL